MASNDVERKPERPTFLIQAREVTGSETALFVFRVACSLVIILALVQAPTAAQLVGLWALTLLALSLGRPRR